MKWLLFPISAIFAAISYIRWKLYRWGIFKQNRAPAPVISVGNIALGGTGKTPCTIWLAKELKKIDLDPVILTRGYKRVSENRITIIGDSPGTALAGDEPALMGKRLPDVPIIVSENRSASAQIAGGDGGRVFILDDGFQHLELARDFDIVLLPAKNPFSGKHFAPVGRLRDGKWRLKETDAIILVGERNNPREIDFQFSGVPVFRATKKPSSLATLAGRIVKKDVIVGEKVIGFAGIADPESLRYTLKEAGFEVAGIMGFKDHYQYKTDDVPKIENFAEELDADILITTEKDAVRLSGLQFRLQVYVLGIEFAPEKPEELIELILSKTGLRKYKGY